MLSSFVAWLLSLCTGFFVALFELASAVIGRQQSVRSLESEDIEIRIVAGQRTPIVAIQSTEKELQDEDVQALSLQSSKDGLAASKVRTFNSLSVY